MATITEKLADWVVAVDFESIDREIVRLAKRNIMDFLGVALAGSTEEAANSVKQYLQALKGPQECTAIGLATKSQCTEAAFANGTLGHLLDYDDLVIPAVGAGGPHLTAAILPAALAVAEKQNSKGSALITAYVIGCEVAYRVGLAIDPSHYNAGWHTTGTEGIFGAAVAAAKLLGASKEEIVFALGIAGSEASGLRENFGTMTKSVHAGQAASKGLKAALLARHGFTSSRTIFEGEAGFCRAMSGEPNPERITAELGRFLCMMQMRLKLYSCCAASHSAIFATIALAKEHHIRPTDVAAVKVICDPQLVRVLVYNKPRTPLEAKFSIQFPIALSIAEGRVALRDFTVEKVNDRNIAELMLRTELVPAAELAAKDVHNRAAVVAINLNDGRQLIRRCDYPPGTPSNPIPDSDIMNKFRMCAERAVAEEQVDESLGLLNDLESLDGVEKLVRQIAG